MNIIIQPLPNKRIEDLTGKQSGRLTIRGFTGIELRGKNTVATWLAECSCGNFINVVSGQFNRGHHLSCGCFRRENNETIRINQVRKHRVDCGYNPDQAMLTANKQERKQLTELMAEIKKRDSFTCQICGEVGRRLHTHHIISFSKSIELRDSPQNLITLCKTCHILKAHSGSFKKLSEHYKVILQERIKEIYSVI